MWFSPSLGRNTPPQRSRTQTTLGAYGVVTQGQGPAKHAAGVSNRPARARKPTVKALAQTPVSKKKKAVIITDDEDEVQPQKRKKMSQGDFEGNADTANLDEGPRQLITHVFSQASEDAQDTSGNTEVFSNLDDSENVSTGEVNADDEWQFSQMEEMAANDAKDARVSNNCCPSLRRLTSGCAYVYRLANKPKNARNRGSLPRT